MRLPNSYGSIYKLSGNRRRPFAAVITQGWKDDGKPIRKYLGYYTTRKDALSALADYNAKPYKIDDHGITLAALYARWTAYRQERNKSSRRITKPLTSAWSRFIACPLWTSRHCNGRI